jgi:alpha-glucan,water dikinase
MPFGVFEKVLAEKNNKEVAGHYDELILRIDKNAEKVDVEVLSELRKTILGLRAPDDLISELHGVMDEAGLPWPSNWEDTWRCINGVWGSKWNERAYLSRRTRGIPHADLFMAVLIQEVVEADYSFVIHTVNPSTGNQEEIYAEIVPGLGETLVGNYPGKAFSFTCKKGKDEPQLLAFPSKSVAIFGSGLIFRSDSNGEDLAGYAGAGLYDSIMLEPPVKVLLDYTRESLMRNEDFRKDFLVTVADIGTIVEKAMGFPQDIEGAYSKGQYYVVQTRPQVGIKDGI